MNNPLLEQLFFANIRYRKLNLNYPPALGIRYGEYLLMRVISGDRLYLDNNVTLSSFYNYLSITKSAVSQMLNVLEAKEYLHRDFDKSDRRKISVTLTDKGQDILNQETANIENKLKNIISRFGEDKARQFIAFLTELSDISEALDIEAAEPDPEADNNLTDYLIAP